MCVYVSLCVCTRKYVCMPKDSSSWSWNISHSTSFISGNKFFEIEASLLSIHPCFSILGQNFGVLGKRNMEGLYFKELPNDTLTHVRIFFFFCVLGLRTNQEKLWKVIWREMRHRFIMGTKNNLSWGCLLLATTKIPFGKRRIH